MQKEGNLELPSRICMKQGITDHRWRRLNSVVEPAVRILLLDGRSKVPGVLDVYHAHAAGQDQGPR